MEILSRQEVAQFFNVNPQTITNWCDKGFLPYRNKNGRLIFSKDAIKALETQINDIKDCSLKLELEKAKLRRAINKEHEKRRDVIYRLSFGHLFNSYIDEGICMRFVRKFMRPNIGKRYIDILDAYLKGESITDIADENNITKARASQLIAKASRMADGRNVWEKQIELLNELNQKAMILEFENRVLKSKIIEEADKPQPSVQPLLDDAKVALMNMDVYELFPKASTRLLTCLKWADCTKIKDIVKLELRSFLKFRNFGKKSLAELKTLIESIGLSFGMTDDDILKFMSA